MTLMFPSVAFILLLDYSWFLIFQCQTLRFENGSKRVIALCSYK